MAKRRSKIEVLEDDFFDLALEEKRRLMPVLQGLLRQQERSGAALADRKEVTVTGGGEAVRPALAEMFNDATGAQE